MSKPEELRYLLSQFNIKVGDINFNLDQILSDIKLAEDNNYDLVIFPELALSGYPPRDFLHYSSFHALLETALERIIQAVHSCHVILGAPIFDDKYRMRNAALVINNTGITYTYYKTLLPDYDVFDESRYFYPNDSPGVVDILGVRVGLQICEDLWDHMWMHPIKVTEIQRKLGAELMINISASPYTYNKAKDRLELVQRHVERICIPFIYLNTLGCQDDLVFDGRSFVVNGTGDLIYSTPAFEEGSFLFDGKLFDTKKQDYESNGSIYYPYSKYDDIFQAIRLNLVDYLDKSHLPRKLLVSLSGGIDSALTLAIVARSVGPENVLAIYLPTKFNEDQSYNDSKQLCNTLGVELQIIEIEELRKLFDSTMHQIPYISDEWSVADENIQARIRSNIVMYLSNSLGRILISTGNKSEIATGYCTLYGDTAGGKNLIGDLYKTEVYEFATWFNQDQERIPVAIVDRPPTAELRENQKDQDNLPPYDILDGILRLFVNQYKSQEEIVAAGFDGETVKQVIKLVLRNEFKRDQLVQSVRVSGKAFGSGRRFPIAANFFP